MLRVAFAGTDDHDGQNRVGDGMGGWFGGPGGGWLLESIAGLPAFVLYFALGVVLVLLFGAVYTRITAHDEMSLIRQGNAAAALAFGGNLIGFSIPLSRAMAQAHSIPDMIIWALAAFVVQLAVYALARFLVPGLSLKIEEGNFAAGGFNAAVAITGGMLNSAAMTL